MSTRYEPHGEHAAYHETHPARMDARGWTAMTPAFHSLLRIVAGFMFLLAGTSKLFAFPTGMPPDGGVAPMMSQIWFAGILEVFGGGLMILGLFSRPVAFLLAGEMAVAYFQVHFPQSFWPVMNGGVSAVLYCFVWLYFSAAGPGPWSVDAVLKKAPRIEWLSPRRSDELRHA